MLPPDVIEEEKRAADWQLVVQVESVEEIEASRTGGTHAGHARARVIGVVRCPAGDASRLAPGDRIDFRLPTWREAERAGDPAGPARLYTGPGAPRPRLRLWATFRGDEPVVAVFEDDEGLRAHDVLARVDRVVAAFAEPVGGVAERVALAEEVIGLCLGGERGGESLSLRGESAIEGDWVRGAELRGGPGDWIVQLALADAPCVRRSDAIARYGSDARPVPAPPTRRLPSVWHLEYERPSGRVSFGFRMAEPHDHDDCLVEVVVRSSA